MTAATDRTGKSAEIIRIEPGMRVDHTGGKGSSKERSTLAGGDCANPPGAGFAIASRGCPDPSNGVGILVRKQVKCLLPASGRRAFDPDQIAGPLRHY